MGGSGGAGPGGACPALWGQDEPGPGLRSRVGWRAGVQTTFVPRSGRLPSPRFSVCPPHCLHRPGRGQTRNERLLLSLRIGPERAKVPSGQRRGVPGAASRSPGPLHPHLASSSCSNSTPSRRCGGLAQAALPRVFCGARGRGERRQRKAGGEGGSGSGPCLGPTPGRGRQPVGPRRPGLARSPGSAGLCLTRVRRPPGRFVCLQINRQRAAGARAGLSPTGRGARRPRETKRSSHLPAFDPRRRGLPAEYEPPGASLGGQA